MAIYEYQCPNKHRFAKKRPMADRQIPVECSECKEKATLVMSIVNHTPVI